MYNSYICKNLKTRQMNLAVLLAIPGWGSIVLIAVVVLLLFGGKKIPELMRGLGRGIKEFKEGINPDEDKEKKE